jgi:hypothetical protein
MFSAFIFFAVIYCRNHKGLRYATAIRDNDFLNEWLAEHKLLRPITIMQSDRIISPLAVGVFKPRIILPKSVNMNDKQLLDYVLTHEYFHIKRCDAIWKMVLLSALCVHWFNPMVWLMFVLASRDLELTCDEAVIYRFGATTKKAYAYMLIGMAEHRGSFAPLYNGFSRNATEERIESIMKIKRPSTLAIVIAALLVVGATTVFAATAAPAAQEQGEKFDLRSKTRVNLEANADDSNPVAVSDLNDMVTFGDVRDKKSDDGNGNEATISELDGTIVFGDVRDLKRDDGNGKDVTIGESIDNSAIPNGNSKLNLAPRPTTRVMEHIQ